MKPWDDLTEVGQFRRLRRVAHTALDEYNIKPTRLSLVGGFTNVIYRVDTSSGPLALRVDLFQDHTDADANIELAWLEALDRDTDVHVGAPLRTTEGKLYTTIAADGVPNPRRCSLFQWVPGEPLEERLTLPLCSSLGQLAAKLHRHGAQWTPPARPMAWDRVFYWPEDADPYVLDAPEHAHHFGGQRRSILDRCRAAVEPFFAGVGGGAQIVHGDLHLENVHVSRNRLFAIDFEDVMWAHPVQDIAITVYYLNRLDDPAALRAAFRAGYETVQPWPETEPGQVDAFVAARELMFANFVLNVLDDPSDFYEAMFIRLGSYLETRP